MFNDYEMFMLSKLKQQEMTEEVKENQWWTTKKTKNTKPESKQVDLNCCEPAICC